MLIDRNRGSGHVPRSLWNLSIRPTRSPPPAYRLIASSLPCALPLRYLEYHCPFAYPLTPSILYRVLFKFFSPSSPQIFLQLLYYFYPLSSFFLVSLFTFSLRINLPISFRTSSKDFFLY